MIPSSRRGTKRPSVARRELLEARSDQLEKERFKKRQQAEMKEALTESRRIASMMRQTKPFELGQATLSEWATMLMNTLEVIENHVSDLTAPPPSPINTFEDEDAQNLSPNCNSDIPVSNERRRSSVGFNAFQQVIPRDSNTSEQLGSTIGGKSDHGKILKNNDGIKVSKHDSTCMHTEHLYKDRNSLASASKLTFHGCITTSLYVVVEAITNRLRAERSVVYQYQSRTDELQAICQTNAGSINSANRRMSATSGWAGQAFTTGMAANVSNVYADNNYDTKSDKKIGYRIRSILCFPIPKIDSDTRYFGVIQVLNKNKGTAQFDSCDEATLSHFVELLVYITQRYPTDHFGNHFDPTPLHRMIPFRAVPPQNMAIPQPEPLRFVYRSHQSGHLGRASATIKIADCDIIERQATITEIDTHIRKLEESWMKAVHLNVEYKRESEETVLRLKELRDLVKQKKRVIKDLSSEIKQKDSDISKLRNAGDIGNDRSEETDENNVVPLGSIINPSPPVLSFDHCKRGRSNLTLPSVV